jgi:uncharacterized membrane protein
MNYKIIGADKQEYGPVGIDELREWIVQRRVDGNTLIKTEGTEEWKTLSSFPELAVFLAAQRVPQTASGQVPPTDRMVQALEGNSDIDFGSCMSRAWTLLQENMVTLVIASLFFCIIIGISGGLGALLGELVGSGLKASPVGIQFTTYMVQTLLSFLVTGACLGGYQYLILRMVRNESNGLSDLWAGFTLGYAQLTLGYIVSNILTTIGLIFCFLPGIFLAICWTYSFILILDRKLGFWEAMELSRKVVMKRWWSVFALVLLTGFITIAGLLLCCVGILITLPFAYSTLIYAYEDIFGSSTGTTA